MNSGQFPLKMVWKRLVNQRIKHHQESLWNENDELNILDLLSLHLRKVIYGKLVENFPDF